ncbi:MAG: putative zinc-binding protein [Sedimentibacter saalensis]|uniref:putative zinc-binding protein n=1 Tax=Sedimentibacter saalensis TaxID=130788 RepID=UPI002B2012FF|nr:putative zinc-binding protein [Sedimentibacter saalensis]MEA5093668.1 putative zinc-binding protein [Sedimentibacter saalensis]
MNKSKVGVLSCSGEECIGGTISRLATRKVMEELREGKVVSLCLPLYVAGGQEERFFAKAFPVIAVEGCDKCCAKKATEKYSGDVSDLVVVSDIIGEEAAAGKTVSTRNLSQEHLDMVDKVAEDICRKVDKILAD